MPAFWDNIDKIRQDFAHSWYFRIWALLWLVCAIVFLVAFGMLSARSAIAATRGEQAVFVTQQNAMQFPRVDFHTISPMYFLSFNCSYAHHPIQTERCPDGSDPKLCFSVRGDLMTAHPGTNQTDALSSRSILCTIHTSTVTGPHDDLISMSLEHAQAFGWNAFPRLWIAPNNNAWVLLTKRYWVEPNGNVIEEWERDLLYHSTQSSPGNYTIRLVIDDFNVETVIARENYYTGFMAIGDIGGVAFFLVLLHTLAMTIVGCVIPNDSVFLSGDASSSQKAQYQTV
jgi:hypothetical protein